MINRAKIKQVAPWLIGTWRFARRIPPIAAANRIYAEIFTERVFTNIYRENMWGDADSRSGEGSNLAATEVIRRELPTIIEKFGVRTMLDIPCGDFHWMASLELGLAAYTGADIVSEVITTNNSRYGAPNRHFVQMDATRDGLPKVDLILCRDLHIHLSLRKCERVHNNFVTSRSTWLAASTYPHVGINSEEVTGGCRPLNLRIHPFHFPEPELLIQEDGDPAQPREWNKFLGVWRVADLPTTHSLGRPSDS